MSAVSNPKEPKTSTNVCILCAVREELTYICRVCLTKFYPLFQAGKVSITCKFLVYPLFFQAGKILALRAKNELSSVSGREG